MKRIALATLIFTGLFALCSCQNLPGKPASGNHEGDASVQRHLAFMERLYEMDTAALDTTYKQVQAAYENHSNVDNLLRLAWVLGTHGHGHSNPWAARKQLNDALSMLEADTKLALLVRTRIAQLNRNIELAEETRKANEKIRALTDIEPSLEKKGNGKESP